MQCEANANVPRQLNRNLWKYTILYHFPTGEKDCQLASFSVPINASDSNGSPSRDSQHVVLTPVRSQPKWDVIHRLYSLIVRSADDETQDELGPGAARETLHRKALAAWIHTALAQQPRLSSSEGHQGLNFELWFGWSQAARLIARGRLGGEVLHQLIDPSMDGLPRGDTNISHNLAALYDINTGSPRGRLEITLAYRKGKVNSTTEPFQTCVDLPWPDSSRDPHVLLEMEIHRFTGLLPEETDELGEEWFRQVVFRVQATCLYFYRTSHMSEDSSTLPLPHRLSTDSSLVDFRKKPDDATKQSLHIKLPLVWSLQQAPSASRNDKKVGSGSVQPHHLVDALICGEEEHSRISEFSCLTRGSYPRRPCIALQLEVWQSMESGASRLLVSTHMPLGSLVLSVCPSPRWYPLGRQLLNATKAASQLTGAVELTCRLTGDWGRAGLLRSALETGGPSLLQHLRQWNMEPGELAGVDIALGDVPAPRRDIGQVRLYLELHSLLLPTAEHLSKLENPDGDPDLSLESSESLTLPWGHAFIRYQFYNQPAQFTDLIPLTPNATGDPDGSHKFTVIQVHKRIEFHLTQGTELYDYLSAGQLELQVWLIWKRIVGGTGTIGRSAGISKRSSTPRFIGSVFIPLGQLRYQGSTPNSTSSLCGCPSGLAWWWSQPGGRPAASMVTCPTSNSLPVFPLYYRPSEGGPPIGWLSARLGLGSQLLDADSSSEMHRTAPSDISPVGVLGWNLENLVEQCTRMSLPRKLPESFSGSGHSTCSTSQAVSRDASDPLDDLFPAEVLVEQAYHLQPPAGNCGGRLSGKVFVTFPLTEVSQTDLACDDITNGRWSGYSSALHHKRDTRRWHPSADECRFAVTHSVPLERCVTWNYRRYVRLPNHLLEKSRGQGLIFQVWIQTDQTQAPSLNVLDSRCVNRDPVLIGTVSMDITPMAAFTGSVASACSTPETAMFAGLPEVHGWYDVLDLTSTRGEARGQILLGVKPFVTGRQQKMHSNHRQLSLEDLRPAIVIRDEHIQRSRRSASTVHPRAHLTGVAKTNRDGDTGDDRSPETLRNNLSQQLKELDQISEVLRRRLAESPRQVDTAWEVGATSDLSSLTSVLVIQQPENARDTGDGRRPLDEGQVGRQDEQASLVEVKSLQATISAKSISEQADQTRLLNWQSRGAGDQQVAEKPILHYLRSPTSMDRPDKVLVDMSVDLDADEEEEVTSNRGNQNNNSCFHLLAEVTRSPRPGSPAVTSCSESSVTVSPFLEAGGHLENTEYDLIVSVSPEPPTAAEQEAVTTMVVGVDSPCVPDSTTLDRMAGAVVAAALGSQVGERVTSDDNNNAVAEGGAGNGEDLPTALDSMIKEMVLRSTEQDAKHPCSPLMLESGRSDSDISSLDETPGQVDGWALGPTDDSGLATRPVSPSSCLSSQQPSTEHQSALVSSRPTDSQLSSTVNRQSGIGGPESRTLTTVSGMPNFFPQMDYAQLSEDQETPRVAWTAQNTRESMAREDRRLHLKQRSVSVDPVKQRVDSRISSALSLLRRGFAEGSEGDNSGTDLLEISSRKLGLTGRSMRLADRILLNKKL